MFTLEPKIYDILISPDWQLAGEPEGLYPLTPSTKMSLPRSLKQGVVITSLIKCQQVNMKAYMFALKSPAPRYPDPGALNKELSL